MPTNVPETDVMLAFANERLGVPVEELIKRRDKYKEQFSSIVKQSDRLMTFLFLKNELGLTPPALAQAISGGGKVISIAEVLSSVATSGIGLRGYVLSKRSYKNKAQKEAWSFQLGDKSGIILGIATFDDEIKLMENVKKGDFIEITNARINEWEGRKKLKPGSRANVIKIDKPDYPLSDLAIPVAKVVPGSDGIIQVSFLTIDPMEYIGCPYCTAGFQPKAPPGATPEEKKKIPKVDIKEGQTAKCRNCGEVIATKLTWINGLVSDGDDDLKAEVPPKLSKEISPNGIYVLLGHRGSKSNEFLVDEIVSSATLGGGSVENRFSDNVETGPSIEEIKRRLPLFLKSRKQVPETQLAKLFRPYVGAKTEEPVQQAITQLVAENLIVLKDGVYTLPVPA